MQEIVRANPKTHGLSDGWYCVCRKKTKYKTPLYRGLSYILLLPLSLYLFFFFFCLATNRLVALFIAQKTLIVWSINYIDDVCVCLPKRERKRRKFASWVTIKKCVSVYISSLSLTHIFFFYCTCWARKHIKRFKKDEGWRGLFLIYIFQGITHDARTLARRCGVD